ncbi:type II and III secretion system protein family protein [Vibrio sp. S4M6]|uniref:type II and III secretion system protein family protein n=1 Tax=Vibrio sinus TaxID=2946865 RepID=UPI00202A608C|nr:type II and III secretion system protein family protein [Vibrio sinus]MCL9781428.1 type II and III secretion system protein family protein [Vibrio sinus]
MKQLTIFICLLLTSSFYAVASTQTGKVVKVPHHKSTHVNLAGKAKRVSLGDPEVLDFVMLRSNELFLIGKKLGSTNLMAWDYRGRLIEAIDIEVTHDLNSLKAKLYEFLPDEKIEVHSSQNRLILSGMVTSKAVMNVALRVAETYAAGESVEDSSVGGAASAGATTQSLSENVQKSGIINLMTIGGSQQVMLEVTVAEVQRTLLRKFDANLNFFNNGTHAGGGITSTVSSISGITPSFTAPAISDKDYGILGGFVDSRNQLSIAIDIAKENGSAKILAEPNLTALSGTKAELLAGGEFPIPVPDENGITIEYKEYGVGLTFIPTILSDKNINLEMAVDVSEIASTTSLTYTTDLNYTIYPLTRRSASSTLELADGQTIGIAGLLNESVKDAARKIPGLGEVPILGQLFNSSEYIKGETELVILVTAKLAKTVDRDKVVLPTDLFIEPTDMQFYMLGISPYIAENSQKIHGLEDSSVVEFIEYPDGGTEGTFGHSL